MKTGNDASPYMIDPIYAQALASGSGFADVTFPLQGTNAFSLGNTLEMLV